MTDTNLRRAASPFASYDAYGPAVPVVAVTRSDRSTIHRFYDTSPISPSGRYIALTELPFEDRLPSPGDAARVIVTDLSNGAEVFSTTTRAWDTQVGAHVQWGSEDTQLYFNCMSDDWKVYSKKVDIISGQEFDYSYPIYSASPSGRFLLSPSIEKLCLVQPGYGAIMPNPESFRNSGFPNNDGIFLCDATSGEGRLLLSLEAIRDAFPSKFTSLDPDSGGLYGFHVKWSPNEQRIMFIVRWVPKNEIARKTRNFLITCNSDGSNLKMPIDNVRWIGGHHPNWCPDSEHIVMNLRFPVGSKLFTKGMMLIEKVLNRVRLRVSFNANPLRFAIFRFDGQDCEAVATNNLGSGHPTLSLDGKSLLSDAYPYERVAFGDGSVPLRFIDLLTGKSVCILRIKCKPDFNGPNSEYRVDLHPAWDRTGRYVVFNGCPNGPRQVFIADFSSVLSNS